MIASPEPFQGMTAWQEGLPYSAIFGDVYFSRDCGIAETRYVFLHHNHLPQRWQKLHGGHFTIAETGFGTGLNFLCAWQLWQQTAPSGAVLHFVSTELYPLLLPDMRRALALWPELAALADALLAQYTCLARGWNRFVFADGQVVLTLLVGDAADTLPQLQAGVDAWFLDGFAPAKNPGLWQDAIFSQMARLSHATTTLATYTSAGAVRRGLQQAGFAIEKVPGHGSKREMLRGQFTHSGSRPHVFRSVPRSVPRSAIVIGGGIAGTSTAHSLARRGVQVTLLERHACLASEASGNPVGVLYPRLSGSDIPLSRIARLGFQHTLHLLQSLPAMAHHWAGCGLLQLAFDAREAKRCMAVAAASWPQQLVRAVDRDEAAAIAGVALRHGGLYLPSAGWVNPAHFCRVLAQHPAISVASGVEIQRITPHEQGWQASAEHGQWFADVLIIACANQSARLAESAYLPLQAVRGQITLCPATALSLSLNTVLCTDGYVSPAIDGLHCLGATFAPDDSGLELRAADHRQNLHMLNGISPELHGALCAGATLQGRAALRCATPDYLPLAGQLLDAAKLEQIYDPGSRASARLLPWLHGLYVNTGHGSKGMLTAPLCAELIAAQLCGEPLPVDGGLLKALNPNRFLLRERGLRRLLEHFG